MPLKVYEIGEFDSRQNIGVVTAANNMIKYLQRLDIEVEYITFDNMPHKKIFLAYKLLSIPYNFGKIRFGRHLRNLWAIRALQEVGDDDILHIHSFTLLPHLLQSLNTPKGVVLTFYGTHRGIINVKGYTNPYYLRAMLEIPDVIIADKLDSELLIDRAGTYLPGNVSNLKKKILTFPYIGIDEEVFDPEKVEPHRWYNKNLDKEGLVIFKGGAIEKLKSDHLLIKIADNILSRRRDVYFVWAGYFRRYPPKDQAELKAALDKLCKKYPKNVFYIGTYDYSYLPSLLKGADVIPYLRGEFGSGGLSTFAKESAMMGKYILASNIGWYSEFMGGSSGIDIVDWGPDNKIINEVTNKLMHLADNRDEAKRKGRESRAYALRYGSAKVSAKQHKMIYEAMGRGDTLPSTEELLKMAL